MAFTHSEADRALRGETASKGTTVPVEPEDWSRILEHPDPQTRLRAMTLLRGSALSLVKA